MPVSPSRAQGASRALLVRVPILVAALAVAATAAAPGLLQGHDPGGRHRVVSGDTLSALALANDTTVAQLKQLNGLRDDMIMIGQLLLLPGAAGDPATGSSPPAAAPSPLYVVRPGDTLIDIATRAGTTQAVVRSLNPLPADGTVVLGQRLRLPAPTADTSGTVAQGGEGLPAPALGGYAAAVARSRARLAAQPVTSRTAAQELIRAEALRRGVDPSLALAVSYQESGFAQAVVSRTDAVGVMQLMPATAAWVGPALLGRTIDRYDIGDNIAGGVALLRALLDVADVRTAVASYYQGLERTRSRGLLPETRVYVASVLALQSRFR